jgi:hypothetical protein
MRFGEIAMCSSLQCVLDEYSGCAIFPAGKIVLMINDALRFCQDLRKINKGVIGLELWYYEHHEGRDVLVEYPWSPDYSRLQSLPDFAEISIETAEKYIASDLPEFVTHIGFVL